MPSAPHTVLVVGAGAVGTRLAARWREAGLAVSVFARSAASTARASALGLEVRERLEPAISGSTAVVLCVPDSELEAAARDLARALDASPGLPRPVALHTAGSRSSDVLAPLARAGCATGTLHPLAAFAPTGPGPDLSRAFCAISGDERARATAEELCRRLGARALRLSSRPDAAARYHAAATLLSNGTVALASAALELAGSAAADEAEAREAFLALLAGTVENLRRETPERALTGPAARGDASTLRAHLAALADDPETAGLYRALTRRMVALAVRDGRLRPEDARELERFLAP